MIIRTKLTIKKLIAVARLELTLERDYPHLVIRSIESIEYESDVCEYRIQYTYRNRRERNHDLYRVGTMVVQASVDVKVMGDRYTWGLARAQQIGEALDNRQGQPKKSRQLAIA